MAAERHGGRRDGRGAGLLHERGRQVIDRRSHERGQGTPLPVAGISVDVRDRIREEREVVEAIRDGTRIAEGVLAEEPVVDREPAVGGHRHEHLRTVEGDSVGSPGLEIADGQHPNALAVTAASVGDGLGVGDTGLTAPGSAMTPLDSRPLP